MARLSLQKNISLAVLIGTVFVVGWLWWLTQPAASVEQNIAVVIEEGEGVRSIAQTLKDEGVIRSPWYFIWQVKAKDLASSLQAGEYQLSPTQRVADIITTLSSGGGSGNERSITIIEGWRITDMAEYLEERGLVDAPSFQARAEEREVAQVWCEDSTSCEEYSFLRNVPPTVGLEGFLFPDTYRVYTDTDTDSIIRTMLANFERKLTPQMRADIAASDLNLYETVILASIIEKEVRTAEDMALVSGIFHNRLGIGMALQSDATLTYYFDNTTAAHSSEELAVDTPYNTYKYRGLPPTPIASPGFNALRAAIYPAETNYFYFLSDTETGQTYFSETLDEHNQKKRLYVR